MIILKNLKPYENQDSELSIKNSIFLKSECGRDWYETVGEFQQNTVKIMYDSSGRIVSASLNAHDLTPVNFSVAEIDHDGSIDELLDGKVFDEETLTVSDYVLSSTEIVSNLSKELTTTINSTIDEISKLKVIIDVGLGDSKDTVYFEKLRKFLKSLIQLQKNGVTVGSKIPSKPKK